MGNAVKIAKPEVRASVPLGLVRGQARKGGVTQVKARAGAVHSVQAGIRRGSSAACESCCSLPGRDRGGCSGSTAVPFQGVILSQNKTCAIPV